MASSLEGVASAYAAVAYRWGYLNGHQYFVYVGTDKAKAVAMARSENADRGGKYGCVVWSFKDNEEGEQTEEQVAYFNSSWGEDKPFHNYRIDMFERLGHKFHEFAEGTVYLAADHESWKDKDGNPVRVMKPNKMEPPQWVIDEAKSAQAFCDAMSAPRP